ncbi:hypothetical protein [Aquimarina aggregata]|uniref:hypothetical protein n=1 Tax=Aquimarina aggregata TaxID=1642818 RepID=UPI002492315E|nr:hypothetical protein [Aquimarina aggregata]
MSDDFKKITEAFGQAVISFQKDVEYLGDHTNVSDQFIDRKNKILFHHINYQKYIENHIEELYEARKLMKMHITSLTAICVMHGIVDYPTFLLRGKMLLVSRANELQKEGRFQMSYMMNQKLKKLPESEKSMIESILFRDTDREIKELLVRIKKRKNSFVYGIGT